jgi:arginine deiminase
MKVQVTSETGRLNGVIVHTPGREVSLVHPDTKDDLLFDDIIYEAEARSEHLGMKALFEAAVPEGGKVLEIVDLFRDVFTDSDVRTQFIDAMIKRQPELRMAPFRSALMDLSGDALTRFAVEGQAAELKGLVLNPSPNLLFTRDLAAVVRDGIVVSRAAKTARIRESILMEMLVQHHPIFSTVKQKAIRIPVHDTIEGGDILVASEDVVLIGMSERTSFSGVMQAADQLLTLGVKHVLIVDIPKQRSSMHLDTIFTFAHPNECVAFSPAIQDRSQNVVLLNKDGDRIVNRLMPSLKHALQECLERDITFIECGGPDVLNQHREQWSDGANLFCLAPGVVVGYERNTNTFKSMEEHGYTVITQDEFLSRYSESPFEPDASMRLAVTFIGHELCRGRGGARCMTMPISRF